MQRINMIIILWHIKKSHENSRFKELNKTIEKHLKNLNHTLDLNLFKKVECTKTNHVKKKVVPLNH